MTPQEHIQSLGGAIVATEAAVKVMRQALRQTERSLASLHEKADAAQKAYLASQDGANIVPFSGGTNKPPRDDEPVEP